MFLNDDVVAYGRANSLGTDYNDIMMKVFKDTYGGSYSLTDYWARATADGYTTIEDAHIFGQSTFYAPLTHSLILTRGTGDPTYSRATKAWEFGYAADANSGADQVLIEVATGTPRFGGARYDSGTWYNTYADGSAIPESSLLGYHAEGARTNSLLYSRDLTNAAWVATNITAAKTATGLDNATNSASTLTAGAANATILQTLSLAAAARSSSAYVKRRTGSGNIYFTRDGGTSWTDITASVGASWTRVKIENSSVLNPSIGFKIATSGDAIDVDCVQDEAGAYITSPIVTTTAAVTRNADALTYAITSNIDNAIGSLLITSKIDVVDASDKYIFSSSSGARLWYPSGAAPHNDRVRIGDGTTVNPTVTGVIGSSTNKISAAWSGASKQLCVNGGAVQTAAFDGNWLDSSTTISFGAIMNGYFKNSYFWSTALTDAQLQQVTAP